MPSKDIKLHEGVAALKARTEDFCSRLDRIEDKIDHIDECLDRLNGGVAFWKGRMVGLAALVGFITSILVGWITTKL